MDELSWLTAIGNMGLGAGATAGFLIGMLRTKLTQLTQAVQKVEVALNGTAKLVHSLDTRTSVLEALRRAPIEPKETN